MAKEKVPIKQKIRESSQDEQIKIYLEARYGRYVKFEKRHADRYSEVGLPDISLSFYGINVQIEDKLPKEFPRDNQLQRMNEFKESGAIVFWCDSFKMFLTKWEELVEGNELVQFAKSKYKIDESRVYALRLLDYMKLQKEDREKWMKIYKEEGVEITDEQLRGIQEIS